jgi:hypothetical protein
MNVPVNRGAKREEGKNNHAYGVRINGLRD